jgi:hypothetical protein
LGLVPVADAYATRLRAFYNSRAAWHRRFYRLSGVLVVLTGAGLPLLANLQYAGKNIVVSIAGTTVAVFTALHAFYRWDQSWILLRSTEMAVTAAYWRWRSALPPATERADADCVEMTQVFLSELAAIREHESSTFFKDLVFPSATPDVPAKP